MTIRSVGELFFGFYLHFKDDKYDFTKYEYSVPKRYNNELVRYINNNKFILEKLSVFGKQTIVIFAIVNQLKYRSDMNIESTINESDSSWFIHLLKYYKTDFKKDVEYVTGNITELRDIYDMHIQKKIQWYSMFIIFMLLKTSKVKEVLNDEIVKMEMKHIANALKIFKFDYKELELCMEELKKKIELLS